jgi:hypothetical protein
MEDKARKNCKTNQEKEVELDWAYTEEGRNSRT